ncbi:hypothetical protein SAMN04515660_1446 [Luteibacter sp. 329MFSha]|nr:hypothetical protein SAMN04515660_1446 [Luteibacter sp. 329MFSha]
MPRRSAFADMTVRGAATPPARHPGARRGPRRGDRLSRRRFWRVTCRESRAPRTWIPACAGMTVRGAATFHLCRRDGEGCRDSSGSSPRRTSGSTARRSVFATTFLACGVSRKPCTEAVDTGVRRYDGEGCGFGEAETKRGRLAAPPFRHWRIDQPPKARWHQARSGAHVKPRISSARALIDSTQRAGASAVAWTSVPSAGASKYMTLTTRR